jgi:hypothetical protein
MDGSDDARFGAPFVLAKDDCQRSTATSAAAPDYSAGALSRKR